jgi:hypothetical protein
MQALRQIVNITDNSFHFVLPIDFKADKVEIIVLPVEEPIQPSKMKNSEKFFGAISQETAQKLHNHLNEVRSEWERNIY